MTAQEGLAGARAFSSTRRTLADAIDPRNNGLNLVRLILASSVVIAHSYALTDREFAGPRLAQILGSFPVDGFFAISGFLLAESWHRRPEPLPYLRNRALRLFPGLAACLVIVAFVFAPIERWLTGYSPEAAFTGSHNAFVYVAANLSLWFSIPDVAGGPQAGAFPGVWNGSLWTLGWEFVAYIALLILGSTGLLRRAWLAWIVLAGLWASSLFIALGLFPDNYFTTNATRFGFMFAIGMAAQWYRYRIPVGRRPIGVALVCLVASPLLPDYRILGGFSLAYLLLLMGGAIHRGRWQLRAFDLSYGMYVYAFPIQQMLIVLGGASLPVVLFVLVSLVATVPFAAASWILVERPALSLKNPRSARLK